MCRCKSQHLQKKVEKIVEPVSAVLGWGHAWLLHGGSLVLNYLSNLKVIVHTDIDLKLVFFYTNNWEFNTILTFCLTYSLCPKGQ